MSSSNTRKPLSSTHSTLSPGSVAGSPSVNSSAYFDANEGNNYPPDTSNEEIRNDDYEDDMYESDSSETRDYLMAKRINEAEVINNRPTLNPLMTPFLYFDGTTSLSDGVKQAASGLKNLIYKGHSQEENGMTETSDKDRMRSIKTKIDKLESKDGKYHAALNTLHSMKYEQMQKLNGSADGSPSTPIGTEKENIILKKVNHHTEPVTLPSRDSTWKHTNKKHFSDTNALRLIHSNISSTIEVEEIDPQDALDKRNEIKTANYVDSFLLGYSDVLCLTSSFMKDENGIKKGPLIVPLLSLYFTDVTNDVYISTSSSTLKSKLLSGEKELGNFNTDEILRMATFAKNRVFKLHLEYGVGNYVLRWDIEKDAKSLLNLHKKLNKKNPKDRIERIKRKEVDLPKFPVLPSNYAKFRGLFKGDREIMVNDYEEPGIPLERQISQQGSLVESVQSVAHTLNRFSNNAFGSFKKKDKSTKVDNEKENEKQLMILHERIHLNKKYKEDMQAYFDKIFETVTLKDQSQKLLQFLELSPFSLLLANEIYRKRKEGYMYIVSTAAKQGWRVGHFRFQDLGEMIKRHSSKWCIMGDSFLMYTSEMSSTTPEEVFLIDSKVKMVIQGISNSHYNINKDDEDMEHFNLGKGEDPNDLDVDNDNDYFDNPKSVLKSAKSYPTIKLSNSERTIKLVAKNPRVTLQWAGALRNIINETEWGQPHRFNSFAPIRNNAFAQWFVDARDYWYAASSAIEMAKDVIYIHDWWLSPELYLRRPANGNQNWRIDRLLEKKAKQGVKIFIIVYRNVGNTVVTDSMYTKHSLLELHENIYVLRSPNQIMQQVFFWAHHEKLLIIDHSVCFLGGVDLCFGRYDTPDHALVDDAKYSFKVNSEKQSNENSTNSDFTIKITESSSESEISKHDFQEEFQVFPGKDYSNPRRKDFSELSSPHDDMYDRQTVPRMPWHDVHMVTSGQVARDLSRHFIQRWNFLLRQKRPSRPTPLLVPPRPFTEEELEKLNLKGTCEIQLLRSSCEWSLGLKEHEQSIQNAYIKCIEQSEHFVYIENQFFITSCTIDNCVVKNEIGDALVDRIITAHKNGDIWKAVIVIPLMPGFEADVDTKEGGSVRLIMQCQYMSISMGDTSIFARLRRVGIRPEDYITFYSLRKWGLIGPNKLLTTEQLYIHAKTMIVDDRIAIIGSANINERSMRGTRDSEVCAIVRDKQMLESKMDGKPYHVGQFAHTLRVRLMREHLGVDVDLIDLVDRRFAEIENFCKGEDGCKASVLEADEGNQTLSAMVEMGTRYLLGMKDGTEGFKSINSTIEGNQDLTKKMISKFTEIRNEADESEALDNNISFSFNHRAGYENSGIRSAKNLSKDTRVKTESHKNEVKGDYDGLNTKHYEEAKIEFNKFLKEKVNRSSIENFSNNDKKNFPLPDFEDIEEILSQTTVKDATIDEIDSLNKDRWMMIKRLFYMSKLYMKMKQQKEEDKMSDSSLSSPKESVNRSRKATVSDHSRHETRSHTQYESPMSNINTSSPSESGNSKTSTTKPIVPLSKLTADELHELDKNILPHSGFEFIDPYGFEDPLDINFYEGTWMTQAIRNTLLFQMVFHTQPDDSVQTWSDYKNFEEMKKAFAYYQNIHCGDIATGGTGTTGNLSRRTSGTMNTDVNNEEISKVHRDESDIEDEEDAEEHRRRVERNSKLAELERYQRFAGGNFGGPGLNICSKGSYDGGTVYDYESCKKLMELVKGHVVMFPTRWLQKEVEGSNWFYKADKIPPIQIYD